MAASLLLLAEVGFITNSIFMALRNGLLFGYKRPLLPRIKKSAILLLHNFSKKPQKICPKNKAMFVYTVIP